MNGRSETHAVGFIATLHGFLPHRFAEAVPRRWRWRRWREGLGLELGRSKNPCGDSWCVRGRRQGGGRRKGWNWRGESRSGSETQRIRGRRRGRGNRGKECGALIEKASICLCEIGSLGLVGLLVVELVVALRWWPPSPFWLCQWVKWVTHRLFFWLVFCFFDFGFVVVIGGGGGGERWERSRDERERSWVRLRDWVQIKDQKKKKKVNAV